MNIEIYDNFLARIVGAYFMQNLCCLRTSTLCSTRSVEDCLHSRKFVVRYSKSQTKDHIQVAFEAEVVMLYRGHVFVCIINCVKYGII